MLLLDLGIRRYRVGELLLEVDVLLKLLGVVGLRLLLSRLLLVCLGDVADLVGTQLQRTRLVVDDGYGRVHDVIEGVSDTIQRGRRVNAVLLCVGKLLELAHVGVYLGLVKTYLAPVLAQLVRKLCLRRRRLLDAFTKANESLTNGVDASCVAGI